MRCGHWHVVQLPMQCMRRRRLRHGDAWEECLSYRTLIQQPGDIYDPLEGVLESVIN